MNTNNTVELLGYYGGDETHKKCSQCNELLTIDNFYKNKKSPDGYRTNCKQCQNKKRNEWYINNKERAKIVRSNYRNRIDIKNRRNNLTKLWTRENINSVLLTKAKKRAKKLNIPFNITKEDISVPEKCPILGIPLKVSDNIVSDNSPTLDRLIPELGYVKGNVTVISFKANRIKNNASINEIRFLLKWLENEHIILNEVQNEQHG